MLSRSSNRAVHIVAVQATAIDVHDVEKSVKNVKNELRKGVRIDTVSEPGGCKSVLPRSICPATA